MFAKEPPFSPPPKPSPFKREGKVGITGGTGGIVFRLLAIGKK
jgi:hypothetical protein